MEASHANLSEATKQDIKGIEAFLEIEKKSVEKHAAMSYMTMKDMPGHILSYMKSIGIQVVEAKPSSSTVYIYSDMLPGDMFEEMLLVRDEEGVLYRIHGRIGDDSDGSKRGIFLTSLFRDKKDKPIFQWITNRWDKLDEKHSKKIRSYGNGYGPWVKPEEILPAYKELITGVMKGSLRKVELGSTMIHLIVDGLMAQKLTDFRISIREDMYTKFVEMEEGYLDEHLPLFDIKLSDGSKLMVLFGIDKMIRKTRTLNTSLKIISPEDAKRLYGIS